MSEIKSQQLSGRIFMTDALRQIYEAPGVPRKPQPGDLKIMAKLDGAGLAAVLGRHTNNGYSGNFHASVFDGEKWQPLNLETFIPYRIIHFNKQGEKPGKLKLLMRAIEELASQILVWVDKAFEPQGADELLASQTAMLEEMEREEAERELAAKVQQEKRLAAERERQADLPRRLAIAHGWLRTGSPVSGVASGINASDVELGISVELGNGMQGILLPGFVRGCDAESRLRRANSIGNGQQLSVRVVRVRKEGILYLMEDGASLLSIIQDEQASRGGALSAYVLDIWGDRTNPRGLFVRIMNSFRAVLPLDVMLGDSPEKKQSEMWGLYGHRYRSEVKVTVTSARVGPGPVRISVRQVA
jgi:hypothetical protein